MIKIKKLTSSHHVYDIEVEGNHNYFANDLLVHNCSEIIEAGGKDKNGVSRTPVCCLMSVNAMHYDAFKNNQQFFDDVFEALDNTLNLFIKKTENLYFFKRARASAMLERSVGLGLMGLHSLFQAKLIPFESAMAKGLNMQIFKNIYERAELADTRLYKLRGPCPDSAGTDDERRFTNMIAVAPTASTSIIMGNISPGIEPIRANVFNQKGNKVYTKYNNQLKALLKSYDKDNWEVWQTIIDKDGSVQHLDFLTQNERDVFKTAMELDQAWVIELAADRQQYIDQSQSVNLFFTADVSKAKLHYTHLAAWKKGMKTLYYLRTTELHKMSKLSKVKREEINHEDISKLRAMSEEDSCIACQ